VTIIEAYGSGLPVIVSDRGSAAEMIQPGRTGWHFRTGDPADLASKVLIAMTDAQGRAIAGRQARDEFERRYNRDHNYDRLIEIYRFAMRPSKAQRYGTP
jgi:glycosyltransferase involved in cell wall biosynthesis